MRVPTEPASQPGAAWVDEDSQDVRLYALTDGKTTPWHALRLETLVATRPEFPAPPDVTPQGTVILQLCAERPCAVAEIAATIELPVVLTKVVLSALLDSRALAVTFPDNADPTGTEVLEAVLANFRSRWKEVS